MSKAVRIREHLYAEIASLAQAEHRSLIAQLEVLLEQALKMGKAGITSITLSETGEVVGLVLPPEDETPRPVVRTRLPQTEDHFKPDPK